MKINFLIFAFTIFSLSNFLITQDISEPHQHIPKDTMELEDCFSDDSSTFCYDPNKPKPTRLNKDNLFFLTPWNKISFTHAINHASSITHVSPVWFYLTEKGPNEYLFDGIQDIDHLFIKTLKSKNPNIKILPRFYVNGRMEETKWFFSSKIYPLMVKKLIKYCTEFDLDGIIFDIPLLNNLKYKGNVKNFMELIKSEFGRLGLLKFNTFSGYRFEISKNPKEIMPFFNTFDKTLISTYDYKRGWLSPKGWFLENARFWKRMVKQLGVNSNKIMLGIQFYGYLETIETMSRRQFQVEEFNSMIENQDWDFQFKEPEDECLWSNEAHRMFYPCILFI